MSYKIELRCLGGWDDAGWTTTEDESDEEIHWRFETIQEAQEALENLFRDVKEAVANGSMEIEENPGDYRIVLEK